MLRRCSCVIALAGVLVGLPTAQAAETTLTLACQGTVQSGDNKPEPISMGIIVNFTNQTVHGLRPFPVAIIDMNEVTVSFGGQWGTTTRTAAA